MAEQVKLYFTRPVRSTDASPWFGVPVMRANQERGVTTNIILDANVLRAMDDDVCQKLGTGGTSLGALVEASGLAPLVAVLRMAAHHKLALEITPGRALSEFAPARRDQRRRAYEKFFDLVCPGAYCDTPDSTWTPVTVREGEPPEPEFKDLPLGDRATLAVSYYSLLQLHLVQERHSALPPEARFHFYLKEVLKHVGIVAAHEVEIAKLCFCDRRQGYSERFNSFAKDIKANFFERSGRISQRQRNILNAARDLSYLRFAQARLDLARPGEHVDPWLVTLDRKLFRTAEAFHHVMLPGGMSGLILAVERPTELQKHEYWRTVDGLTNALRARRIAEGVATREVPEQDFLGLIDKLERAIDAMDETFSLPVIALHAS